VVKEKLAPKKEKPAILVTSATHSRELITIQMGFYSLLKMLHEGIVWKKPHYLNLLEQNKFFFIPTVNVDGLALIEDHY